MRRQNDPLQIFGWPEIWKHTLQDKWRSCDGLCTVENLAYKKDSFINSRRQYKRHTRRTQHSDSDTSGGSVITDHQMDRQNDVDSGIHSCTVLDNFYVETPVWMVDLGKQTIVSGVIIVTWPGNPNGTSHLFTDQPLACICSQYTAVRRLSSSWVVRAAGVAGRRESSNETKSVLWYMLFLFGRSFKASWRSLC